MGSRGEGMEVPESSWMGTVMRLLCLRVVTVAMRNVSGGKARDDGPRSEGEGDAGGGCP